MNYRELFHDNQTQSLAHVICELAAECWRLQLSDSTGFSISARIKGTDAILVDKSGTGFRHNQITPKDLILINEDGELLYADKNSDNDRLAPVNVAIHLAGYRTTPARGCIHWHDPWTIAFAAQGLSIKPYSLQSKLIGEVPCIKIDDRKLKAEYLAEKIKVEVPSGLHSRPDVYYVMEQVAVAAERILKSRVAELDKHGLVVTHFEHGLFAWGRSVEKAFENGYRSVRNAQAQLFSKLVDVQNER